MRGDKLRSCMWRMLLHSLHVVAMPLCCLVLHAVALWHMVLHAVAYVARCFMVLQLLQGVSWCCSCCKAFHGVAAVALQTPFLCVSVQDGHLLAVAPPVGVRCSVPKPCESLTAPRPLRCGRPTESATTWKAAGRSGQQIHGRRGLLAIDKTVIVLTLFLHHY